MTPHQIIGLGVDIEKIQRFRDIPLDDAFFTKYFTSQEIAYCLKTADPAPHFAVRFAAKEAVMKALTKPIGYDLIEVHVKDTGAPYLGPLVEGTASFVSLSHNETDAVACVILLRE